MIKNMGNMKNGKYRETSKMSDLICENYPMVLVMSRFGIDLGFGEKTSGKYAGRIRSTHIHSYCRQLSDGNGDNPGSGGP